MEGTNFRSVALQRWLIAVSVVVVGTLTVGAAAFGAPDAPAKTLHDDAEDCLEGVPAEASVAGVTDHGEDITLNVHVLLDGVSLARGIDVMSQAQKAYRDLKITIQPTFQEVDFPAQKTASEFPTSPPVPSSDSSYLFDKSKAAVGGQRPPNTDVVYLLTSDHITGGTAGQADCIGGVRYPNRAFAIGEEEPDGPPTTSVWLCCSWPTAKIAAHEIAHLLGAHHHYSNCAEGAPAAVDDRHIPTCTLMMTDVGLINLRMSLLEAAVVRGHAVKYADRPPEAPKPQPQPQPEPRPSSTPSPSSSPTPEPSSTPQPQPEPEPEPVTYIRSVELTLARHLVAHGTIDAGENAICSAHVDVRIQRRTRGEWTDVAAGTTRGNGSFRISLRDVTGTYRALVDQVSGENHTCAAAASTPQRHRHRSRAR